MIYIIEKNHKQICWIRYVFSTAITFLRTFFTEHICLSIYRHGSNCCCSFSIAKYSTLLCINDKSFFTVSNLYSYLFGSCRGACIANTICTCILLHVLYVLDFYPSYVINSIHKCY